MEKKFVNGPLLPEPQEVFERFELNWSTNVSIEGPGLLTDTGYHGYRSAPEDAKDNPCMVVRSGYADVRAIFILHKNISKEEWPEVAIEAISRPECAMNGGTGTHGLESNAIKRVYKGLSYLSEYPFKPIKPAFCLEELYDKVKFTCGTPGPCQRDRKNVAGQPGAKCKPGDRISYSLCSSMPCNCGTAREHHSIIKSLEKILPTRQQLMLLQKYEEEEEQARTTDVENLKKKKRSEAARKGWETRRRRAAERVAKPAEPVEAQMKGEDVQIPD